MFNSPFTRYFVFLYDSISWESSVTGEVPIVQFLDLVDLTFSPFLLEAEMVAVWYPHILGNSFIFSPLFFLIQATQKLSDDIAVGEIEFFVVLNGLFFCLDRCLLVSTICCFGYGKCWFISNILSKSELIIVLKFFSLISLESLSIIIIGIGALTGKVTPPFSRLT